MNQSHFFSVKRGTNSKDNVNVTDCSVRQNIKKNCNYFLADVYRCVNFEGLQICPHFADFEFTNWTRNGEVPYCQLRLLFEYQRIPSKRRGQLLGNTTFYLNVNLMTMLMVILVMFRDKKKSVAAWVKGSRCFYFVIATTIAAKCLYFLDNDFCSSIHHVNDNFLYLSLSSSK